MPPCRRSCSNSCPSSPGATASRPPRCAPTSSPGSSARWSCFRKASRTQRSPGFRRNTAFIARSCRRSSPRCGALPGTWSPARPTRCRWSCSPPSRRSRCRAASDYIALVLTLTLLVGCMQLAMGVARLGALVNFISHTVIVGFTAGAGLLIIAAQLPNFFGVQGTAHRFLRQPARLLPQPRDDRPLDHRDWCRHAGRRHHRQADAAPRPVHDRGDGGGQRLRVRARAIRSSPTCRPRARCPSGLPLLSAAVARSRRLAQARAGGARPDRARPHRSRVDRARDRAEVGAAHRRQPGIHRPGPVEHRGRVHVVVSVLRLVQPQRRELRGGRPARRWRPCSPRWC